MVILPDGGRSYLSKIFSDAWMRQYGFLERDADLTVGDVLRRKREAGEIPPLVTVQPQQGPRRGLAAARAPGLPAARGLRTRPEAVVGSIGERGLLKHAAEDPALLDAEIVDVMEAPFPAVSSEDPVREAVELLVGEQPGAARHRRRPRRRASSPAPTCWRRWPMSDASRRRRVRDPRRPRRPGARPVLRLGHPGRSTRPRPTPRPRPASSSRTTTTRAGRTRRAPRSSRRSASWRAATRSAFSSGMAAEHALITAVCAAGDHMVLPDDLYGGTYRLVDKVLSALGPALRPRRPDRPRRASERAVRERDAADLGRDARPTRC